ncbi:YraN family protein [Candidatus Peregrinibacteria bacterium]|nr:YraN family protein [Candidatus Peregrinibacteria bacterium]
MFVPSSKTPLAPHLALGSSGEELAVKFLMSLGYTILHRNVRMGRDEIDIIAEDTEDEVLVFVEVKTRAKLDEDFLPSMNAGPRKWKKLRRAAWKWTAEHSYDGGWRMDLVSVAEGSVIDHVKEIGSWF